MNFSTHRFLQRLSLLPPPFSLSPFFLLPGGAIAKHSLPRTRKPWNSEEHRRPSSRLDCSPPHCSLSSNTRWQTQICGEICAQASCLMYEESLKIMCHSCPKTAEPPNSYSLQNSSHMLKRLEFPQNSSKSFLQHRRSLHSLHSRHSPRVATNWN